MAITPSPRCAGGASAGSAATRWITVFFTYITLLTAQCATNGGEKDAPGREREKETT